LDFYVADVGAARIDSRFQYTGLPAQQFVWFCRRGHPLANGKRKTVSRKDLMSFPLATPKMPAWAIEWFAAACDEQGEGGLPRPFPAVECESYAMLKRIVASSDCISAALRQTLTTELEDGSLAVLPVDAPELTTQAGIIQLPDRALSPLGAELIAYIEELANSEGN
jgi:DNA-binding transcriptional LysR family regulator